MKLIYVITNIKKCGPFNVIDNIIKNLDKNIEVIVVSLFGKDDKDLLLNLQNRNIKTISLKLNKVSLVLKGRKKMNLLLKEQKADLVHSHGILPDYCISKQNHIFTITTIHNNMYEDYIMNWGKLVGRFWINVHLRILKHIRKVVCCSKTVYDVLSEKFENITYIRNGIEIKKNTKQSSNK